MLAIPPRVSQLEKAWAESGEEIKSAYGEQAYSWQREQVKNPPYVRKGLFQPQNPQVVVDDMIHALTSTRPKRVYYCGYSFVAKLLLLCMPRILIEPLYTPLTGVCEHMFCVQLCDLTHCKALGAAYKDAIGKKTA